MCVQKLSNKNKYKIKVKNNQGSNLNRALLYNFQYQNFGKLVWVVPFKLGSTARVNRPHLKLILELEELVAAMASP